MFPRVRLSALSTRQCFFIGFVIGCIISVNIQMFEQNSERSACDIDDEQDETGEFEPKLNLAQKPMQAKKAGKNIVRPRYYTSELGIREKVFVSVLARVDTIESTSTAFNRTVAHLVDKIKYFINAENVKYNFKLKNIVGFTDTRENLRMFHILKYVADNYLNDYDYFLFVPDTVYLNARVLVEKLRKISVSADVYLGHKPAAVDRAESSEAGEENFCDINAGVILSNSMVRKIRTSLDWCVRNANTNHHHINLGKCVKYASQIAECQSSYQNVSFTQYKLSNHKIYRDLHYLKDETQFNDASTVYPITNADDFYLLHIYFSRINLQNLQEQMDGNQIEYTNVKFGNLPDALLEKRWPIGVPESKPAETRHDIITWQHMNETHSFMRTTEENTKELSSQDKEDIQNIIHRVVLSVANTYNDFTYRGVHSIYKKYDPVRGSDYILHLHFNRTGAPTHIIKSFEVVKPLGSVEIVQSPYVTEGTRVTLIVPIFEHQIKESIEFINRYQKLCLDGHENTFLMIVFMYNAETPNRKNEDAFLPIKNLALSLTETYKESGQKIAWVSIRLPENVRHFEREMLLNSVYGEKERLSLAVTDLALRKIGLDSLVMLIPNSVKFYPDFLNRVRMNTIQTFQVYSPIGFSNYPCKFTSFCKECEACDVSQASGYFDVHNFDVLAFYGKDYVEARKALEGLVPIVRKDKDIEQLFQRPVPDITGVVDIFLKYHNPIHILRAIEPNLRYGMAFSNYLNDKMQIDQCYAKDYLFSNQCMRIGAQKQLSESIAQFEGELLQKSQ